MAKSFHLHPKFETYGEFWAPNDSSKTITGRLAREARQLQFTSSPTREPIASNPERLLGGPESFDVLHGYTTEGPCTLFGVQSGSPTGTFDLRTGQAISFRRYRVSSCVFGLLLPKVDVLINGSTKFSYSGLSHWITVHHDISQGDGDVLLVRQRKSLSIFDLSSRAIRSRIKLEIIPYFQRRPNGEYNFRHESVLCVDPANSQSLDWHVQIASRFENIFSLLVGTPIALKSIGITHEGQQGWLVTTIYPRRRQKTDPTLWLRGSVAQLVDAVLRWLETPEEFRLLENLIYGAIRKTSLFVETEFLALAQAVESFHRLTDKMNVADTETFRQSLKDLRAAISSTCKNEALAKRLNDSIQHANEPSFQVRVQRLLARLPEEKRRELLGDEVQFEKTLRHSRNYFTHPGIEKNTSVLTGTKELFLFNQKLHALLRWLLLIQTGFSADDVFELVQRQASQWT